MILNAFTVFHVVLSLIGIGSGVVAIYELLEATTPGRWTKTFLATTTATTLTGFLVPISRRHASPGPRRPLSGRAGSREHFDLSPPLPRKLASDLCDHRHDGALFQRFVLVVQLFRRVPALTAMAPTQSEPPFQIAQLAVLLLFAAIGIRAATTKPLRGLFRDSSIS
jgi:hypothetical protein